MSDNDEFGAFLVGFIVGGLTGAVAALLMAPQTGEDTRNTIREKAIVLGDRVSTSVEDAYAKAEASAVETRTRFDELAKMTKEKADELSHKGKVLIEEQRSKVTEVVSKVIPGDSEPIENV